VPTCPIGSTFTTSKYLNGFIAWSALALIVLTSLPIIRQKLFEFFRYTHYAFIVFFAFAYLHTPSEFSTFLYVIVAVYVADQVIRCVYGLLPKRTRIIDVRHKGMTRLGFDKNKIKKALGLYRPGQFVSFLIYK
jgi:hypothetical protein